MGKGEIFIIFSLIVDVVFCVPFGLRISWFCFCFSTIFFSLSQVAVCALRKECFEGATKKRKINARTFNAMMTIN